MTVRPSEAPALLGDSILLSLCTDTDTVAWCELAERYARALFTDVEAFYWAPGEPWPAVLDDWEGDWLISFRGDLIIPEAIYSRARKGAINFHPSPPWYRGLGGQYYALFNEEARFGTTCHHLAPSVDAGDIIAATTFDLAPGETLSSLRDRVGGHAMVQYYDLMANYIARGIPLPASEHRWGDRLFTSTALTAWIDEIRPQSPDHACFR